MPSSLSRFKVDRHRPTKSGIVRRKTVQKYTLETIYAYYESQRRTPYNSDLMATQSRILVTAQRCFGARRCVTEIMPKDVRAYVAQELARGFKTATVRRQLDSLCASVELYIRDKDLPIRNPFYRARVPKSGYDAKRFVALTSKQLAALRALCYQKNDSSRWILAILTDTGARTSEVSGASLLDFRIDASPPHLVIEERPWRRLKTRNSRRLIPLAGVALWAAHRVIQTAAPGQTHAFPQYVKNNRLTSCGSNLHSWLRNREFNISPHGLRHTFIDRLRDIDCPVEVRRAIMGWAMRSAEARYGVGPSLSTLAHWVNRVAQEDYKELNHLQHLEGMDIVRTGACQNAEVVLRTIKEMGKPTFVELLASSKLTHKDAVRGLNYCRHFKAVEILNPQGLESRRNFRYRVTGRALPDVPLAQPGRRPKPLGIVKTIRFRSETTNYQAPCFPAYTFEEPCSKLVSPRRSRLHCAPKGVIERAPLLPANIGRDRSTRTYAETLYAHMTPGHVHGQRDIAALCDLTASEFFRAKAHLLMLGIVESCEWNEAGRPIAVRLTGKPLPVRKRIMPPLLSRSKFVIAAPDSV